MALTFTVTSPIKPAMSNSAAPASTTGFFGRTNSGSRVAGSFAAMCASQMTPAPTHNISPAIVTVPANGSQKTASKTARSTSNGEKEQAKNCPPVAAGTYLMPPLPASVQSFAEPPSSLNSVNAVSSITNPLSQASGDLRSAFPTLLPTSTPLTFQSVGSLEGALPAGASRETAAAGTLTTAQPEANPPQAANSAADSQDGIFRGVLSGMQPAVVPEQVEPNLVSVATPGAVSQPNGATASQAAGAPTRDAAGSAISGIASDVDFGPPVPVPGPAQPGSSSNQTGSVGSVHTPSKTLEGQSSINAIRENIDTKNVRRTELPSPIFSRGIPTQLSPAQSAPEKTLTAEKQEGPLAQTLRNELRTLINSALVSTAVGLRQTPALSGDPLPAAQTAHPSSGFTAILNTTPAVSPDVAAQVLATPGKNGFTSTAAAGPVASGSTVPTVNASSAVAGDLQSGTSGGDSPDPSLRKPPAMGAPQNVSSPAASHPSAAIALADPAMQGASVQPAPPGWAHKSESGAAANSLDPPSTLPASGEFPIHPSASSVQMAQIVNKAAQSEMRIGLNTAAFGNVEVRTIVHANEVGVLIGSEKGDLRSLLSNELPGIAHNLQQQDLRLNQVNFHQQGFAFSNQMSSGSDSQPRSFASRQMATPAVTAEISSAEAAEPAEPWTSADRGLSILA